MWSWFCSSSFEQSYKSSSTGLSITIPIYNVPVTFGGSNESGSAWQKRQQACQAGASSFSGSDVHYIYKEVTDPEAYSNYAQCIKSKATLVSLTATPQGQTIELTVTFTTAGTLPPPVISDVEVTGATCTFKNIAKGKKILSGSAIDQCQREGNSAVSIVVNTNYGASSVDLDPIVPPGTTAGVGHLEYTLDRPDSSQVDTAPPPELICNETHDVDVDHAYTLDPPLQLSVDPSKYRLGDIQTYCEEVSGNGCPFTSFVDQQQTDRSASVRSYNWGTRARVCLKGTRYILRIVSSSSRKPDQTLKYGGSVVIDVPAQASSRVFIGSLDSVGDFAFDPANQLDDVNDQYFELISKVTTETDTYYTYRVKLGKSRVASVFPRESLIKSPASEAGW